MLLAQNPKLLLVDEPAAGMTDEETPQNRRTAHEPADKHSIVVIEHDILSSARSPASDRPSPGRCPVRRHCGSRANDERVLEVYLGRKKKVA